MALTKDEKAFLNGGGEMAALIGAYDWSASPLGPIAAWPSDLKSAVGLVLRAAVPMTLLWGNDGVMLYNDAYGAFAGKRHPSLLGQMVREAWPEVAAFNDRVMRRGLAGENLSFKDQELTLHRHGHPEQVFMNLDYSPVPDQNGMPVGVLAIVVETTDRVLAERSRDAVRAEMRVERDRAQKVLDAIGEAFVLLDREFRLIDLNAEAARLEGRPLDQVIGKTHWEAHPDADPRVGELFREAMAEQVPVAHDHCYRWADGRVTWIDMRAYPVGDGLAVFYRDITETRLAEHARAAQEAERSAILAQLAEGVIVADRDGRITFVNDAAERLHGTRLLGVAPDDYSQSYRLLTEAGDPYPPRDLPLARAVIAGETVTDARWLIHRPDGSRVVATGSARPIIDARGDRVGAVLTIRDDTESAEAERQLLEESRSLETLNRTAAALAGELDLERLVQMMTDAGVVLTGAQFGAYFHNLMDETGERLHLFTLSGADRAAFETLGRPRATAIFGPTFRNEGVIRSADILADPRYGRNAPHRGMPEGHLPVRSYLAVPVVARSGHVLGGLLFGHPEPGRFSERHERLIVGLAGQAAIAIDNARLFEAVQDARETLEQRIEQRTHELNVAHDALRQSQKMEAVGQLTGGIAHDFNNLLTGVIGSLDLMQRKMAAGRSDGIDRHLDAAVASAGRAAALTHRLLAFSRRQPLDPRTVDVPRLVGSMEDMLRRTIGEQIALDIAIDDPLWPTLCDPHQLESALLNLVINARDAMPDGGRVTIGATNVRIDPAGDDLEGEARAGAYVCIAVSDTGIGMDAATIERAFEPFFTTKPIGQGTGLGLSMIYGFARQSGGHARIDSEPGLGSTIRLYLPRHHSAEATSEEEAIVATPAPAARDGEVVLVVEDESAVRALVCEVLGDMGYRVIEAHDGPSGLAALSSDARIDLLVTDVGLPGLNGRQLADAARATRPVLPVLFMTGYAESAAINGGFLDPGMALLTKPFDVEALTAKLATMQAGWRTAPLPN